MRILVYFMLIISFQAFAGIETQSDWSEGGGIPGPVLEWESSFYSGSGIEHYGPITLIPYNSYLIAGGSGIRPYDIMSVDVDGDGDMDVLESGHNTNAAILWWNNIDGLGTQWEMVVIMDLTLSTSTTLDASDIDGDGDMDVIAGFSVYDQVAWWDQSDSGAGIFWTRHTIDNYFDDVSCLHHFDIDNDGDMDILGSSYGDQEDIAWWENSDGTGIFVQHILSDFPFAKSIVGFDADGDGDGDIAAASSGGAGTVICWLNQNGTGTSWLAVSVDTDFNGASCLYVDDVDDDGDMDLIGAAETDNEIAWWENNGTGTTWSKHCITDQFEEAVAVHSGDFDGDGDTDVLGTSFLSGTCWWENQSGSSWEEHVVDISSGSYDSDVCSSDINGDGQPDFISSFISVTSSAIKWWNLEEFTPSGSLESSILNVDESPDWRIVDWISTEPSGTSVAFQVRASDDYLNMGAWSDTLTSPCSLNGIIEDGYQYFQYRAILSSSMAHSTPVLQEFSIVWLPQTSIEQEPGTSAPAFALRGAVPNPSCGMTRIVFELPVSTVAELTVFDLAGRMVYSSTESYSSGVHQILLWDLADGMYIVRMQADDFSATSTLMIIE